MIVETTRIYTGISLLLLAVTLICHLVAMTTPRWKIYEHNKMYDKTISIGVFHRCDHRLVNVESIYNKPYPICDDNKYCFHGNQKCQNKTGSNPTAEIHNYCNQDRNPFECDYSPITKGLISCTIIAACMLGISFLLLFSHIFINQFKYKIHLYISGITICLLFLGSLFLFIALVLLGSSMPYDLYQYRYALDYKIALNNSIRDNLTISAQNDAARDYNIRLDWSAGLEIAALILSSFTLVTQIIYLFSTYRNRIG